VAGTGFVPRPGQGILRGVPARPQAQTMGILQVQAGSGLDHISDFSGKLLTREWTLTPLRVRFLSGEESATGSMTL